MIRRDLVGDGLERICVDSSSRLPAAALPTAFYGIPSSATGRTRCGMSWVRCAVLTSPPLRLICGLVMNAKPCLRRASAARRFADCWEPDYPKAVAYLRDDLDELLTWWYYKSCAESGPAATTIRHQTVRSRGVIWTLLRITEGCARSSSAAGQLYHTRYHVGAHLLAVAGRYCRGAVGDGGRSGNPRREEMLAHGIFPRCLCTTRRQSVPAASVGSGAQQSNWRISWVQIRSYNLFPADGTWGSLAPPAMRWFCLQSIYPAEMGGSAFSEQTK